MEKSVIGDFCDAIEKCASEEYSDLRADMYYLESKPVYSRKITTEDDKLIIIPIGDIHYGSKNCDIESFNKTLNFILDTPNAYTVLVGDLMETATKTSIGAGVYEQTMSPNEQMKQMVKALKPLAEQNKILCSVGGNHEFRIMESTSIDPTMQLCALLNIPYEPFQMYINVEINDVEYKVFVTHGKGGGSSKQTKIKNIAKPAEVAPLMDLYISGHFHSDITDKDKVFYMDDNGKLKEHIRRFVMCGNFLKYVNSYAEQAVLPPSIIGAPEIFLFTKYKYITVLN